MGEDAKGMPRGEVPQGGESCRGKKQERGGISPPTLNLPQTSLMPRPNFTSGLEVPSLRSHTFLALGGGMLFSGCGPGINYVALFTLDTLYTALQPAGEIKASEMVYDAT